MGGPSVGFLIILLCILAQVSILMSDWFLSYWVELDEEEAGSDRNIAIYSMLIGETPPLRAHRHFFFWLHAIPPSIPRPMLVEQ